ncbi:ABC transporter permease subunit [Galbitalea sp. SE-J8]|uniref:ABC transporter permease n=1 Tax=Galbitalea sp. SE-J8 TaxID=3054952 RepID=UPI00259CAC46|nr:ABC transporter permease subunit [Galbitalea sp. SE-J8]MDM4763412.1 ABC transporter permease subunit [Galbitalea sp. SE-J8]
MPRRLPVPSWLAATVGILVVIAVWWIIAVLVDPGEGRHAIVPTPPAVIAQVVSDGFSFYTNAFVVTLREAGFGYLAGNVVALVLCALVLVLPPLEGVLNQIAVISYCLPLVAIGPILKLILGGATSTGDTSATATFVAGLSVFFTTVVGSLLGLKASDRAALDVITVYGGSRLTQLRKVRIVSAIPHVLTALQIAVPAAFLGAILGEYFGAIDLSVGTLLLTSQSSGQSERLWGLFLMCAFVAIIGYGLVGLVARAVAPWARGTAGAGA